MCRCDGVVSPDGWLWKAMILAALDKIAVLNTSLGCTIALFKEHTDTTEILVGSFFVFRQAMMNYSRSSPSSCS